MTSQAEMIRVEQERRADQVPDVVVPFTQQLRAWTAKVGGIILPFATIGAAFAIFRHGKARSRRSLRRVGHLTIAVSAPFLALSLANEYILRRFQVLEIGYGHDHFRSLWGDLAKDTSHGILALWVILALARCWRTEPGWADRLGRAFGIMWIGHMILNECCKLISIP
jgi:hypothetical protein